MMSLTANNNSLLTYGLISWYKGCGKNISYLFIFFIKTFNCRQYYFGYLIRKSIQYTLYACKYKCIGFRNYINIEMYTICPVNITSNFRKNLQLLIISVVHFYKIRTDETRYNICNACII